MGCQVNAPPCHKPGFGELAVPWGRLALEHSKRIIRWFDVRS